ncbi:MAG: peptide chain release factor N(5)-glutamine methyltransferase [Pseudomonadota bacterium]
MELPDIASAVRWAAAELRAAGIEEARRDARLLLSHTLDVTLDQIIGYPERPMAPVAQRRFAALVARRGRREPVSRILGYREFWSLPFEITPDTLDPRPESEILVEAVLREIGPKGGDLEILDLGSGSGCLLLALLWELPEARGLGLDIAPGAVETASGNAATLGLAARAAFKLGDWTEGISGSWQVIVSNPPYIRDGDLTELAPEVALYEPRQALAGGADGLKAYRRMIPQAAGLLAAGGLLALEIGHGQANAVSSLLTAAGLCIIGRERDLAGVERCLLARKSRETGS